MNISSNKKLKEDLLLRGFSCEEKKKIELGTTIKTQVYLKNKHKVIFLKIGRNQEKISLYFDGKLSYYETDIQTAVDFLNTENVVVEKKVKEKSNECDLPF